MKDKEKQITKSCKNCVCNAVCDKKLDLKYYFDNHDCKHYQPKLPKDSIVLSKEEYEEYQAFKNGDYCATKCDIHELSFNQMNKISDLENEKLKNEIKNPNEVLEDRERFRARNEELKKQLAQSSKETAEKILKWLKKSCAFYGFEFVEAYFKEQFGVEIKEN